MKITGIERDIGRAERVRDFRKKSIKIINKKVKTF